jgi:YHS domain-containing protein
MTTDEDGEGGVSIDPICGRPVVEDDSETLEYKKRKYFFCSDGCRDRFERQAERIHVGELAKAGSLFGERKVRWGVA